jgi:hypothetical protein
VDPDARDTDATQGQALQLVPIVPKVASSPDACAALSALTCMVRLGIATAGAVQDLGTRLRSRFGGGTLNHVIVRPHLHPPTSYIIFVIKREYSPLNPVFLSSYSCLSWPPCALPSSNGLWGGRRHQGARALQVDLGEVLPEEQRCRCVAPADRCKFDTRAAD